MDAILDFFEEKGDAILDFFEDREPNWRGFIWPLVCVVLILVACAWVLA